MATQDYAYRERKVKTQRKKATGWGKNFLSNFTFRLFLLVILLLACILGLVFISKNKNKEKKVIAPSFHSEKSLLPPEPQERWRYIKELEQQQTTIPLPENDLIDNSASDVNTASLVNEQRQLLDKMKSDIQRHEPTQLEEVPWNASSSPDKNAIIHEKLTSILPLPAPKVTTNWHLQCGAFKQKSAAESLKARLALEGIESHIHQDSQWYRLQIGSYRLKSDGEAIRQQLIASLKMNCHFQATEH